MNMNKLAENLHVPGGPARHHGRDRASPGAILGTSPDFWLGLEKDYDLQVARGEFETPSPPEFVSQLGGTARSEATGELTGAGRHGGEAVANFVLRDMGYSMVRCQCKNPGFAIRTD